MKTTDFTVEYTRGIKWGASAARLRHGPQCLQGRPLFVAVPCYAHNCHSVRGSGPGGCFSCATEHLKYARDKRVALKYQYIAPAVRISQNTASALSESFMQAEGEAEDYPGRPTSIARAYGSLVADVVNSTDVSSDELNEYQVRILRNSRYVIALILLCNHSLLDAMESGYGRGA